MNWDALLYQGTTAACLVAGIAGVGAWYRGTDRVRHLLWSWSGLLLALLALGAWTARWLHAGHLPLFGTYESALSLTVAVTLAALLWDWRASFRMGVVPVGALIGAALLIHASFYDASVYALTISERSIFVDVHAFFAWSAFGVLAANLALALRTIWLANRGDDSTTARWMISTLKLGFVLHSGMMASGSFYKFLLFGKAWSFDPIELMGFVVWVAYGTLLHLHLFAGWKGRRLAAWSIFLAVLLVVSYRFIVYFPAWSTYHILDVDLRIHLR